MTYAKNSLELISVTPKFEIVGFTGTQDGMRLAQKDTLVEYLATLKQDFGAWTTVHGGCVGADELFHVIASSQGYRAIVRPSLIKAKQSRISMSAEVVYPPTQPLKRNNLIAKDCHIMLATPKQSYEVLRSGTWSTIRYARKFNKPLIIIRPDGSVLQERLPHGCHLSL